MTRPGRRIRKSLGVSTVLAALFVTVASGYANLAEAQKSAADSRTLWTYDTGG